MPCNMFCIAFCLLNHWVSRSRFLYIYSGRRWALVSATAQEAPRQSTHGKLTLLHPTLMLDTMCWLTLLLWGAIIVVQLKCSVPTLHGGNVFDLDIACRLGQISAPILAAISWPQTDWRVILDAILRHCGPAKQASGDFDFKEPFVPHGKQIITSLQQKPVRQPIVASCRQMLSPCLCNTCNMIDIFLLVCLYTQTNITHTHTHTYTHTHTHTHTMQADLLSLDQ